MKPWSLVSGGQTLFTMPRIAVLRGFVLNHTIHHRADLCVYLRLNDIPVPCLYGPSGDEAGLNRGMRLRWMTSIEFRGVAVSCSRLTVEPTASIAWRGTS